MKPLTFTLIIIAISFTFGFAVLTEVIDVTPQPVATFSSVDELENNPVCNCANPENPDEFGPEFCDRLSSVQKSPICNTSEDPTIYPDLVEPSEIQGEGCSARFWKAVDEFGYVEIHSWPIAYKPDQNFNDVFYTDIKKSDISIEEIDVIPFDFLLDDDEDKNVNLQSSDNDKNKDRDDKKLKQISKTEDEAGPTLIEALYQHPESYTTEGKDDIVREAVAALLNAAHQDVDYPYSERDVISLTQEALAGGDYSDTLEEFQKYNNLHEQNLCP